MEHAVSQIGLLLIVATGCAIFFRLIKLPPLLGYLTAGLLLGPLGAGYISHNEWLEPARQISLMALLFMAGLELDWTKAKHQAGTTAVFTLLQMAASFAVGYACVTLFGLNAAAATSLGAALALSSTVTVLKILSDSRDMHTLQGRLTLGILLIQDGAAALAIVIAAGLSPALSLSTGTALLLLTSKAIAMAAILWMTAQYVLPYLFSRIARSTELLFISSLAWCFAVVGLSSQLDIPVEVGGLLAGISLASLPYTLDIVNRLRSLRDICFIILFVILGAELTIPSGNHLAIGLGLIVVVAVVRPAISFLLLNARGYRNRTSFFVSLAQGQLSEISLLIVAIAATYGTLPSEWVSTMVFATVMSFFISVPIFTWRGRIYTFVRPLLQKLEPRSNVIPELLKDDLNGHIVILGYHRMGYHILKKLRAYKPGTVIVDFNPDIVKKLTAQGVPCLYGDIQDEDLLELVQADTAAMVISTIPHREETSFLIERLTKLKNPPLIIVTSHHIDDALEYYKLGASYVILPHLLGGEHVGDLVSEYQANHSLESVLARRAEEVKLLRAKNHSLYYD